jgi:Fic family protein
MISIEHVSPTILNLIAQVDEFKGKWMKLQDLAPDRLETLRKVATIASVGSSTRIEGSKLSDSAVEAILSRIEKKAFHSRDEEEVAGYAEAMNLVFDVYEDVQISENYFKQLHSILLQYSRKDQRHKGEYKKLSNNVEAFDETGERLGIVFETATPFDTPFKMSELIKWYVKSESVNALHPLLRVALFVLYFLAIHPFQDGNGRLSRVLTTLMLLQSGYAYVPYCSLESIVEENKDQYYRALRMAQKTLYTDNSRLEKWLLFFMKTLKKQTELLEDRIRRESVRSLTRLPKLSVDILNMVRESGQVKISDILDVEAVHRNTIKNHLKKLVEDNYLDVHGTGRGTYYTAKSS